MRPVFLIFFGIFIGVLLYGVIDSTRAIDKGELNEKENYSNVSNQITENISEDDQIYQSRRTAITNAVDQVSKAVVSITAIKVQERIKRSPYYDPFFERFFPEFFRNRRYQEMQESIGSGFIISPDGYVVSNEHVVSSASKITISLPNGKEYEAKLVGTDPISDIALIKVDNVELPFLELGDSDKLMIGEWAIALGNPFGLFNRNQPTVTVGVISATDRDFGRLQQENRVYQDMIQTDAAINTGNSGGPLVNARGQVIGMNTFIFTGSEYSSGSVGIGFAIPINRIKEIVAELKLNKRIDRDYWIGLKYLELDAFRARQLGYNESKGIYVAQLAQNSPAEKAGIELGDIVVEINDIKVFDEETVNKAMGSAYFRVGDVLPVKIWREGRFYNLNIVLESYKND